MRKRPIKLTLDRGKFLRNDQRRWWCPWPPAQAPQRRSPHSRLQHREEGVWLWSLLQLAALLPAQPDDVAERLRSVGLPLKRQG